MRTMKKLLSVGIATAVLGAASWSVAGNKWPLPLSIDPSTGGWAQGQLGQVRNSADASSYIGCSIDSYSWGGGVYCYAFDGTNYKGCWHDQNRSNFSSMARAAQSVDGDALLQFADAADGSCEMIIANKASHWEPKQP